MENYCITDPRYERMKYAYCGRSGLMLSRVALGFWHNFGYTDRNAPFAEGAEGQTPQDYGRCRDIVHCAFDSGVTYFDLANNYGPPYGSAPKLCQNPSDTSGRRSPLLPHLRYFIAS